MFSLSTTFALWKSWVVRLTILLALGMFGYACVNEPPAPIPRKDNGAVESAMSQVVASSQESLMATPTFSEENSSKSDQNAAEDAPVAVKGRPTASYMPDQGFISLDERILRSTVIVRATMRSVSAASLGQDTPMAYFPMIRFTFDAHEYLKGSGGDIITADIRVSCSGCSYLASEQEAIDVAEDWIASELDRWWENRESILFLDENELANSEASGQSASTIYKFIPWIEYRLPIDNYATTEHYPYSATDGFSVIGERHRVWLPSVATSSSVSGASDSRFMLGENPNDPHLQSAAGFSSFDADITLSALKSRIKAVADLVAQGEGVAEYEECLRVKFMLERIPWEPYAIEVSMQSGRRAGAVVVSDASGGREYYGIYFFSGVDKRFFEIVIEDDDSDPYELYHRTIKTLRPLVAGDYSVVYHQMHGILRSCIGSPVESYTDTPTANWTIHATAPAGTLHEAFFDPVAIDAAVGADGDNGALTPAAFQIAGGADAEIRGIDWDADVVTIKVASPPASLANYHIDFIALDGSAPLRLDFDDAATAEADGARALNWDVCAQPWQPGDLLMLRIAKTADGAGTSVTYGTGCEEGASATATPISDQRPAARNLTAEPSHNAVMLEWQSAEYPALTGYRIFRRLQSEKEFVLLADLSSSETSYTDAGPLVSGVKYIYRVRALPNGSDARVAITTLEGPATATPAPAATATQIPDPTATPEPTATPTLEPVATATPSATPEATATPTPTATATIEPTATATPEPPPSGGVTGQIDTPTVTRTPEPTLTATYEPLPPGGVSGQGDDAPTPTPTSTATSTTETSPTETPTPAP